jgi:hypothetical protein
MIVLYLARVRDVSTVMPLSARRWMFAIACGRGGADRFEGEGSLSRVDRGGSLLVRGKEERGKTSRNSMPSLTSRRAVLLDSFAFCLLWAARKR